jgi:hypothetical protein
VAKARQKNVNQDWKEGSQAPGERVYLDISSIKDKSYGGSCLWVLIVDDYTDYCWSIVLRAKSGQTFLSQNSDRKKTPKLESPRILR